MITVTKSAVWRFKGIEVQEEKRRLNKKLLSVDRVVVVVVVFPKCWNAFLQCDGPSEGKRSTLYRCVIFFVSTEEWSDYITAFCAAVILPSCRHRAHWRGFSTAPLLLCHHRKTPNLDRHRSSALNEVQITGVLFWGDAVRCGALSYLSFSPPSPSSAASILYCVSPFAGTNESEQDPAVFSTANFIPSVDWVRSGMISILP